MDRYHYIGGVGGRGGPDGCNGRRGSATIVRVPCGTDVKSVSVSSLPALFFSTMPFFDWVLYLLLP